MKIPRRVTPNGRQTLLTPPAILIPNVPPTFTRVTTWKDIRNYNNVLDDGDTLCNSSPVSHQRQEEICTIIWMHSFWWCCDCSLVCLPLIQLPCTVNIMCGNINVSITAGNLVLLLARLMGQYCFARWRLSSSVEVCNTPLVACRRLQKGDDVILPPV